MFIGKTPSCRQFDYGDDSGVAASAFRAFARHTPRRRLYGATTPALTARVYVMISADGRVVASPRRAALRCADIAAILLRHCAAPRKISREFMRVPPTSGGAFAAGEKSAPARQLKMRAARRRSRYRRQKEI